MNNKIRNKKCLCESGKKTKKCFPYHTEKQDKRYKENVGKSISTIPEQTGFYYKADKDDGITLITTKWSPSHWEIYKEWVDGCIQDIQEDNEVDETYYLEQIKIWTKEYWSLLSMGKSTIQPPKGQSPISYWGKPTKRNLEESNLKGMMISGNIGALTELGVIKQDNFNGTTFIWNGMVNEMKRSSNSTPTN